MDRERQDHDTWISMSEDPRSRQSTVYEPNVRRNVPSVPESWQSAAGQDSDFNELGKHGEMHPKRITNYSLAQSTWPGY